MKNNLFKRIVGSIIAFSIVGAALTFSNQQTLGAGSLEVYGLTCEYNQDPEVVDAEAPLLAWKLRSTERDIVQSKYQIMVSTSLDKLQGGDYDAWDSGQVQSDVTIAIEYKGAKKAGTDYFWKVKVWDNRGNVAESEAAKFGIGLLTEEDWGGASWISNTSSTTANANFTVSMRFNLQSSPDGKATAASIIFGAQDAGNYYMYQVSGYDGATAKDYLMLKPHEKKNGQWTIYDPVRIPTTVIPDANKYDTWYTLRIEYDNGEATTYIDDIQVDQRVFKNSFGKGMIGYRACLEANNNEVALYDDITITESGVTTYKEDFSAGNVDGYETIVGTGTSVVQDGALKVTPTSNEFIMFQKINNKSFTIEADFEVEDQALGFVFSHQDNSNFKMWQVNVEQLKDQQKVTLRPHIWDNGSVSAEDIDISSAIPWSEKNAKHHIKIVVEENKITTFIDDKQVHSDTKYSAKPLSNYGFRMTKNGSVSEAGFVDNYGVYDQMGAEIYFSDFSDTTSPFNGGVIEDNRLHLVGADSTGILLKKDLAVYTLEYDFQMEQSATGIVFGAKDEQNFYMWQFKEGIQGNAGKVLLRPHVWQDGNARNLADVDISSAIAWADRAKPHHMRIEMNHGTVTTFIDDKKVDVRSDMPYSEPGMLGFRVSEGEDGRAEKAYYDNIKLVDAQGQIVFQEDFANASDFKFNGGAVKDGRFYAENNGTTIFWQTGVEQPLPYLRKDFSTADKEITRAKIYSSALGVYDMFINGERVGDDYLAPGWTDYNIRVQYQGYDVTDLVKSNQENVFGVRIAPGWYSGRLGLAEGKNNYGDALSFISKLVVDYEDGSSETIITDNTWRYTIDTPIKESDMFDGETYDARNQIGSSPTAWATSEVSVGDWSFVKLNYTKRNLVAQVDPPVQVTDELPAKEIWQLDSGAYVVDLGQNFAGVIKIDLKGNIGDKVVIRHAEVLNSDRSISTINLRSAKATDTYYIGSTDVETYMPSFTFHGFRYVEVTGVESLELDDVTGMTIGSNLVRSNTYESSSELVNQLYENILWGQRGNYLSIPTDCPQRDERLGWTGDAEVFVRTGSYNMDSMSFMNKYVTDIRDAQRNDGAYPNVAPIGGFLEHGSHGWGEAGIIIPWTLYHQYGDIRIIEESFDSMEAFIQYYVNTSNNLLFSTAQHGDWLNVDAETDRGLVATAFFAYSTQLLAELADVMAVETGEQKYIDSAQYHADLFEDIKAAYNKKFVRSDGKCGNETQGSYVLSLAFNLIPKELEQTVADNLAKQIEKDGGHLTTGFLTVGRLAPMLTKYGYNDVAYKLLTNTTYPSWGYSIERGATTIWERWNSCKDDGTIDEGLAYMNSLNHYSLGSIGEWMFTDSLGIDWDLESPGFKHFILRPNPINDESIDMTYAKGSYDSISGNIISDWSYEDENTMIYRATVPANTTATLYLPAFDSNIITESGKSIEDAEGVTFKGFEDGKAVFELASGSFEFKNIVTEPTPTEEPTVTPTPDGTSEGPSTTPTSSPDATKPGDDNAKTGDRGMGLLLVLISISVVSIMGLRKLKKD